MGFLSSGSNPKRFSILISDPVGENSRSAPPTGSHPTPDSSEARGATRVWGGAPAAGGRSIGRGVQTTGESVLTGGEVNSFDAFVTEQRLVKSLALAALEGATLAVDGEYFVSQVLGAKNKEDSSLAGGQGVREPLVHAVGGFPSSLEERVSKFVKQLDSHKIEPLFVLNGLDLVQTRPSLSGKKKQADQRTNAWNLYEKGQGEQAVLLFDEIDPFDLHLSGFGLRKFINILISLGVKFIQAPYTASAQIGYLYQERYVDAVYGTSEAFLYQSIEKVITNISSDDTIQYVVKKTVMNELGFSTHDQFVEAAIGVGCSLSGGVAFTTIEQIVAANPRTTALRAAQEITQANGSIYGPVFVTSSAPDSASVDSTPYLERFQKALASVDFQPVLKDDGKVEPYQNIGNVPNDAHEFVGQRLPDEIFFYLSKGLIGPELLDAVTSGSLLEYAPLDGGDNKEYREFLTKEQKDLKNKAFNLLIGSLHRYYQFKPITTKYWYDSSRDSKFERINPPLYTSTVPPWIRAVEANKLDSAAASVSSPTWKLLLNLENTDITIPATGSKQLVPLTKDSEILSVSILATLQTAGFISADQKLTSWGKALAKGFSDINPALLEPLIIATTLFKNGFLNSKPFTPTARNAAASTINGDVLLISRVAAHINLKHNPIGYTGPLSRTLLSYQSLISKQTQDYRLLFESIITAIFTNGQAERINRTDQQWTDLVKQLPFTNIPNVGTAIATQSYLEEVLSNGGDVNSAKSSLKPMFKQAVDVATDVHSAFELWDALFKVATEAKNTDLVKDKDYDPFDAADKWLSANRF
ncbi:Mkt1p [Sugiyamaella lignohabitans]|uniref:Mkt1p n=1 Tax=Sugiyamaella lignohabitans TaxID=796027 RepID=A0A167CXK2_9ASCO|nr:Mkt1p [Sugiyamaella lignohabitans]ANB12230.1 Mkt1p [Sugiyamaella lignohabitans]